MANHIANLLIVSLWVMLVKTRDKLGSSAAVLKAFPYILLFIDFLFVSLIAGSRSRSKPG